MECGGFQGVTWGLHKADVLGTEEECSVALLGLWGDLRFRLRFRGGKFGVEIEEKNK